LATDRKVTPLTVVDELAPLRALSTYEERFATFLLSGFVEIESIEDLHGQQWLARGEWGGLICGLIVLPAPVREIPG